MKKTYTEPEIVDYGSIAEMTAGAKHHEFEDFAHTVGQPLSINSSGPCYEGYTPGPGDTCIAP